LRAPRQYTPRTRCATRSASLTCVHRVSTVDADSLLSRASAASSAARTSFRPIIMASTRSDLRGSIAVTHQSGRGWATGPCAVAEREGEVEAGRRVVEQDAALEHGRKDGKLGDVAPQNQDDPTVEGDRAAVAGQAEQVVAGFKEVIRLEAGPGVRVALPPQEH